MLAKLRINPEVAETGALSTVLGQWSAFLVSSSSLLVGMVAAQPSQMEKPQLCRLASRKSVSFVRSCPESLSRNFADKRENSLTLKSLSLQSSNSRSLTLESWSFPTPSLTLQSLIPTRDRCHSLTWQSLSLTEGNSQSLTLDNLSLNQGTCFQPISFREVSLEDGSLTENGKSLAHTNLKKKAGTNSFSDKSFEKRMLARGAATNSFSQSLIKRNSSLRTCLRIFLLCSFQLVCAALLLENGSLTATRALSIIAFNKKAYSKMSLQLLAFKARRGQHSFIACSSWSFAEVSLMTSTSLA